jgi:hypothetical protein
MLGPALNHLRQTIADIAPEQRSEQQESIYWELGLLIAIFPQDAPGNSLLRVETVLQDLNRLYSTKPYKPPKSGTCSQCGQKIKTN